MSTASDLIDITGADYWKYNVVNNWYYRFDPRNTVTAVEVFLTDLRLEVKF